VTDNYFDQFDEKPKKKQDSGNFFDQFDGEKTSAPARVSKKALFNRVVGGSASTEAPHDPNAGYQPLPDLMPEYDDNGRVIRTNPFAPPKEQQSYLAELGSIVSNAFKRGSASTLATGLHAGSDFIDQTIQAPLRRVLGELGMPGFEDPLGAAGVAEESLGVEREINADRAKVQQEIGGRPTIRELGTHPLESARKYSLHLANAGAESLPAFAGAIALRNPELAAAALGGSTGAQTYTDMRADGLGRGDAAKAAVINAGIETAGEAMGLPFVMGKAGKGSLLKAMLAEGGQEAPVQLAQQYIEDQTTGKQTPILQQLGDALDAGLVGAGLGAGGHGLSVAVDKATGNHVPQPTQAPNAAPRETPADAPMSTAIGPAMLAAGNAALGVPAEPTADLDAQIDAQLLRNVPQDDAPVSDAIDPTMLDALNAALGPESAAPSPTAPPPPVEVAASQTLPELGAVDGRPDPLAGSGVRGEPALAADSGTGAVGDAAGDAAARADAADLGAAPVQGDVAGEQADGVIDALSAERKSRIVDGLQPNTDLDNALNAILIGGINEQALMDAVRYGAENGRPEIAAAAAAELRKSANSAAKQKPGVPEGSPKYAAIAADLARRAQETAKLADEAEAIAARRITPPAAQAPQQAPTMQNRDRSRAASVAQMQDIRKNPDPERLGFSRDPNTGAPMVGAGKAIPDADKGRTDTVIMASGRRVPVQYAVVEADELAASHDADGRANPAYDAAPLKALNNGRTAGLQAAYASGNTDAYRQGIAADAALHGVPAEAIAGKRKPVLVRLYDPAQNTGDMGAESNASAQLGLSPTEQAQTDARSLPDLSGLTWGEDGSLSPSANVDFFRKWFRNIGDAQAATLQDAQGRPNALALQRVKGALVQRAYGDERLLTALSEDVNPDNRNAMNALVRAAPAFATLDPDSLAGEIRSAVVGGLELLRDANNRGLSLRDAVAQGDLLGRNPAADSIAQFMAANARSANRMAEAFKAMAEYADNSQRQAATLDVFGAAPTPTVQGALGAANIEATNDQADTGAPAGRVAEGNGSGEPPQVPGAAAGDAFALQSAGASAPAAQSRVSQPGLFGSPTQREQVDAAQRSRDAERNGLGRDLVRPEQGDGDLLSGDRPAQARVEASRDMFVTTRGQREEADRAKREQAEARNRPPDGDPAATGDLWPDAAPGGLRPDATPSLTRRAKYAIDALVRRFGGSVLADTLARDFREKGSAQLIGQTIRSEEDFAALAAVYRNPIFETLHYVFVDERGVVLGETAISDRMPASATAFPSGIGNKTELVAWLQKMAPKGARGLWLTHNHPSGNPTPSSADMNLTRSMGEALRKHAPSLRLRGHVVLNHATFGRIAPDGTSRPNGNIPISGMDPLRAARGIPLAGLTVGGPAEAASVGKMIHDEAAYGEASVIVTDARNKVVMATAIPTRALVGKRGAAILSQLGERSGGMRLFLVADAREIGEPGGATYKGIQILGRRGIIADVIGVRADGSTFTLGERGHMVGRGLGEQSSSRQLRMGRGDRVFEDVSSYTPEQEAALVKAGMPVDRRTSLERVKDKLAEEWTKLREAARDSDALKQAVFDRFHGLRMAEAQVGIADPALSPYLAARMSVAQAQHVEATMLYGAPKWDNGVVTIDPNTVGLLDALKPVEGKIDAWLGWMVGRRAKLLKSQGRENNLTDADIAALLSLADGNEQAFKEAAAGYLKIKNAILDFAQEAGVIDPVARAAWDHAEYVPFYRAENEGTIGPGTRRGLAGQTAGIRTLKGGEQSLADPLANIIRNFAKLIDAGSKNRAVLLAVDQLGAKFFQPASREMTPATIPLDQVKKHLREQGVPDATLQGMPPSALKGVQRMLSIVPPTGENVVRVMREGKAEYYEVLDPLVLRSLTAFKQPTRSLAVKPLIWFKRLLTTGVTTTAEFVGANFIRDSGSAWVMSDDRFKPGWDSLAGVAHTLRNDQTAKDMMMAGGTFLGGNFYDGNPDAAAAALRRALRKKGMNNRDIEGFLGTVARSPLHLWDAWMKLSGAVENANRRAVFDAAIKAGKTRAEAAYLARDLMDFNMQGDAAFIQFFSDVLPFFNARLQGLYKLGRRAGTREGKRAILLRGGVITLASLALYAWNVLMHGEAWDELEEWDKDAYWHIAPGTEFHTRIPKPFEIGLAFATLPERGLEAIRNATTGEGDKPSATWDSLVRAITGTLAFNPIPQAFLPLAEQWANKRFFTGRPIESMGDDKLLPEDRGDWFTSDTAKELGRLSSLSPKRLEHLWNGYTAGLGGYVLDTADAFTRWVKDAPKRPEMAPKDWPVLGRFYRGDTPSNSKYVEQFYRRFEKAEQVEQSVKDAIERGDEARADTLEAENKALLGERSSSKRARAGFLYSGVKELRKVRDAMGKLRENAEVVALSGKSPAEKREALDEMTRRRNKLARDAIKQSGE